MNLDETPSLNGTINLSESVRQIQTRADFSVFVHTLLDNLRDHADEWEHRDLASFLEALAAWVEDMDGYFQNLGEGVPQQPSWQTLAQVLMAARVYE